MKILIRVVILGGITLLSNRLFAQNILRKPGCDIKGNISIDTKKRLYHLPGMKDYKITNISPEKGEKWFCTESEAIASGWKKAPK